MVFYVVLAVLATFAALPIWNAAARVQRRRRAARRAVLPVLALAMLPACDNSVEIDRCGDRSCPGLDAGAGGATMADAGSADAASDAAPACDFQSLPPQDPGCPSYPNAIVTACYDGGPCQLAACIPNFANCDEQVQDGCEVDVQNDPLNCGACGKVCPNGSCANMVCQ
jgi:hypothetical protein